MNESGLGLFAIVDPKLYPPPVYPIDLFTPRRNPRQFTPLPENRFVYSPASFENLFVYSPASLPTLRKSVCLLPRQFTPLPQNQFVYSPAGQIFICLPPRFGYFTPYLFTPLFGQFVYPLDLVTLPPICLPPKS